MVTLNKKSAARSRRETRLALGFLAPTIFFIVVLSLIPVLYNLFISFHEWSALGYREFNGLENYTRVLTSDRFLNAASNTGTFVLITVPIGLVLSLIVALGFNSLLIKRGSALIRALYFAPVVASLTAVGFVWLWIFHPQFGLANAVLNSLGIPGLPWLTSESTALGSLAIMYIWARLGFNVIILLAGLHSIDKSYYEAARIDGAGKWRMFKDITFPLLNRQIVLVVSVEVMNAFKLFELPFAATKGGPVNSTRSLVMEIYELAFKMDRWGDAAVYVIALFVFLIVLTGLIRKVLTKDIAEQ